MANGMDFRTKVWLAIAFAGIISSYAFLQAQANTNSEQASKVPEIQINIAIMQKDIEYIKEAQTEQRIDIKEIKSMLIEIKHGGD